MISLQLREAERGQEKIGGGRINFYDIKRRLKSHVEMKEEELSFISSSVRDG